MPLSPLQAEVLPLLSDNRSPDSHLAGATGINISPGTLRYSHDLDLFHSSEEAVAAAYAADARCLEENGFDLQNLLSQPGFIRARTAKGDQSLLIDWARDSIWRFFPPVRLENLGWVLHPVDLGVNKVLALAGRDEPRDLIDALYLHQSVLPLGALIWAATGKDPGLNPQMLLELLQRKPPLSEEELQRLDLCRPLEPGQLREDWKGALASAGDWIQSRPPGESGCLYTHPESGLVFAPQPEQAAEILRGQPGGVLPKIQGVPLEDFSGSSALRKELESFFQKPVA
ncbi:MAG: hypothetical protein AB3N33_02765 [Puniceicoccaceae bacterium]